MSLKPIAIAIAALFTYHISMGVLVYNTLNDIEIEEFSTQEKYSIIVIWPTALALVHKNTVEFEEIVSKTSGLMQQIANGEITCRYSD
jgi:hypothetical protein